MYEAPSIQCAAEPNKFLKQQPHHLSAICLSVMLVYPHDQQFMWGQEPLHNVVEVQYGRLKLSTAH